MRRRDHQKNVAVKTNDPLDWSRYKTLRNDVNNLTRQTKAGYFKSKLSNYSNSPSKESWKSINELTGRNSKKAAGIMKLDYDNKEFTRPTEIANVFNTHFVNIGPNLAAKSFGNEHTDDFKKYLSPNKTTFALHHTSRKVVQKHLKHLSASKATGLDNIPCKLLKEGADIHM